MYFYMTVSAGGLFTPTSPQTHKVLCYDTVTSLGDRTFHCNLMGPQSHMRFVTEKLSCGDDCEIQTEVTNSYSDNFTAVFL